MVVATLDNTVPFVFKFTFSYILVCIKKCKIHGELKVIKKQCYSGKTYVTNYNRQCTTNNYGYNLLLLIFFFFFAIFTTTVAAK